MHFFPFKGVVKVCGFKKTKKQTCHTYLLSAVGFAQRTLLGSLSGAPGSSSSRVLGWRSALPRNTHAGALPCPAAASIDTAGLGSGACVIGFD
ncbi:hypothetical protein AB205_0202590 [Aquarana catesbeiana]|uniref:Uncharacterized protein n=1 Tax=Aquarana catesbeiana TaxID=8400 RepID=A0A2G9SHI5_AQUCT|nr:hypothetical protein AB205_0202590 [Aquarana catesbeiana]PIO38872.1 hypothetical protein AB205_0202590 [Aquarana catesbeiana]